MDIIEGIMMGNHKICMVTESYQPVLFMFCKHWTSKQEAENQLQELKRYLFFENDTLYMDEVLKNMGIRSYPVDQYYEWQTLNGAKIGRSYESILNDNLDTYTIYLPFPLALPVPIDAQL